MLDNTKIGRFLYELRIQKGLNQQELASIMNVSHQAVSKWENGQAIPDTQTLLALSKLYSVSIENILLANFSKKPNEDTEGGLENKATVQYENGLETANDDRVQNKNEPDKKDLDSKEGSYESNEENSDENDEFQIDISKLDLDSFINLIPCIDTEVCEKLVKTAMGKKKYAYIKKALPFVSSRFAGEILEYAAKENNSALLSLSLPFAKDESVDKAMLELIKQGSPLAAEFFPFASREGLKEALKQNGLSKNLIVSMAPFASEEDLSASIESCCEETPEMLLALAPFASKQSLSEALIKIKDKKPELLYALAPFVKKEAIDEIIQTTKLPEDILSKLSVFSSGKSNSSLKSSITSSLSFVKDLIKTTSEIAKNFKAEKQGSKPTSKEEQEEENNSSHFDYNSKLIKRLKYAIENNDTEVFESYIDDLSHKELYALLKFANENAYDLNYIIDNIDEDEKMECLKFAIKSGDMELAKIISKANEACPSLDLEKEDSKELKRLKSALKNNDDELIDEYVDDLPKKDLYKLLKFSIDNSYDSETIIEHADEDTLLEVLSMAIANDEKKLSEIISANL